MEIAGPAGPALHWYFNSAHEKYKMKDVHLKPFKDTYSTQQAQRKLRAQYSFSTKAFHLFHLQKYIKPSLPTIENSLDSAVTAPT